MIDAKRILVIPCWAIALNDGGYHLRKMALGPSGASQAYKKSQALINIEAPQFLGDGTANQDCLADLQQLEVIESLTLIER